MKRFLDDDFLLDTPVAIDLYEKFARPQPIIDYHNHLPPDQVADDHRFQTLTEIWLKGDGDFGRIVKLLFLTGSRRTEMASLAWDEVSDDTISGPR